MLYCTHRYSSVTCSYLFSTRLLLWIKNSPAGSWPRSKITVWCLFKCSLKMTQVMKSHWRMKSEVKVFFNVGRLNFQIAAATVLPTRVFMMRSKVTVCVKGAWVVRRATSASCASPSSTVIPRKTTQNWPAQHAQVCSAFFFCHWNFYGIFNFSFRLY